MENSLIEEAIQKKQNKKEKHEEEEKEKNLRKCLKYVVILHVGIIVFAVMMACIL